MGRKRMDLILEGLRELRSECDWRFTNRAVRRPRHLIARFQVQQNALE